MQGKTHPPPYKKRQLHFQGGTFHFRNFINGVRLVGQFGVKKREDGDFGVEKVKLKCLLG